VVENAPVRCQNENTDQAAISAQSRAEFGVKTAASADCIDRLNVGRWRIKSLIASGCHRTTSTTLHHQRMSFPGGCIARSAADSRIISHFAFVRHENIHKRENLEERIVPTSQRVIIRIN
jgi:hypothetical protein